MTDQITLPGFGYIVSFKWSTACSACNCEIKVGEPGFWNKEKQYCHYRQDCAKKLAANSPPPFPEKKGTANKTPGEAVHSDTANDPALSSKIEKSNSKGARYEQGIY
jgi:hypothetical protein